MATLSHKIYINAPKDRVYDALSTAEGLKSWYTPHLEGEVRQGATVVLQFTGKEPFSWKIVESTPNSRVRWECVAGPGTARGTSVSYRLSDKGDGRTVVELDHEGWPNSDEAYTVCNTFWGMLMGHLKQYAETKQPAPAFS
ncbi:MAG: SRPBCC family protein [Ktedonobacterales bacterium]